MRLETIKLFVQLNVKQLLLVVICVQGSVERVSKMMVYTNYAIKYVKGN